jgi:hypothetical protein
MQNGGRAYLTDIFDTTPVNDPTTPDVKEFLHRTHLTYEQRSDPTVSYRSGWKMEQRRRLKRVDVTSGTFSDGSARKLVRSYHLGYDPAQHASLLTSVQVEGRCSEQETQAPDEAVVLAGNAKCARLPAMTFGYSHVTPFTTKGAAGSKPFAGYEGFDERIRTLAASPPHSVDEELADLFDINADALPDVLVTAPGLYNDGHGVFFNGAGGKADTFGAVDRIGVAGVLGANAGTVTLKNLNINPLDLDGDASIDLLHMPAVKTWSVYGITRTASGWLWQGARSRAHRIRAPGST